MSISGPEGASVPADAPGLHQCAPYWTASRVGREKSEATVGALAPPVRAIRLASPSLLSVPATCLQAQATYQMAPPAQSTHIMCLARLMEPPVPELTLLPDAEFNRPHYGDDIDMWSFDGFKEYINGTWVLTERGRAAWEEYWTWLLTSPTRIPLEDPGAMQPFYYTLQAQDDTQAGDDQLTKARNADKKARNEAYEEELFQAEAAQLEQEDAAASRLARSLHGDLGHSRDQEDEEQANETAEGGDGSQDVQTGSSSPALPAVKPKRSLGQRLKHSVVKVFNKLSQAAEHVWDKVVS